jgi:hypothetical protein
MKKTLSSLMLLINLFCGKAQTTTADFENLPLAPNSAYTNTNSTPFETSNASFQYSWETQFGGYWAGGFAYTNKYDSSTAGYTNLYGVKPLKGYNSSNIYVVGQDRGVIKLKAPYNSLDGFYITNTTYAYKSMQNGDGIARKFGDTTGTGTGTTVAQGSYPDWFKLTVKGFLGGQMKHDSVEFYLADFRFANNAQDYIVNTWQYLNTSSLGQIDSVKYFMYSSDVGQFGINTPLFFGMDNFGTSSIVGLSEGSMLASAHIYPNPFHEQLSIAFGTPVANEMIAWEIFDLSGKSLLIGQFAGNAESLNLAALEKGIYFLELKTVAGKVNRKIIKQ